MTVQEFTKHPTLWYEDGNVVLVAENTGFRVYRGPLVRYSEIFRDMFEIPQPEIGNAKDTHEGCPVVHLADDGAEEVATVLSIIFELSGSQRFYSHNVKLQFLTVASALRLGYKYGFTEIKDEAIRRIRMCYTAERDEDPDHDHTNSIRTPSCQVWWDNNDCIAILHFARQLGLKDLAPIALFQCAAHISSTDILFAAASNENMDRIHTLSFAELQECIKVREFLVEQKLKFFKIFSDIQQSPRTCRQPFDVEKESCFATLAYLTATAHSSRSMTSLMAMRPMDEWLWRHSGDENSPGRDNLCNACAPRVFTAFSELQKGIWYDICVMSGWNLAEDSDFSGSGAKSDSGGNSDGSDMEVA